MPDSLDAEGRRDGAGGEPFATMRLPAAPTVVAPDGSDVRVLLRLEAASMAHFELGAGRTSKAVRHRTVGEIWYFLGGHGEMWRRQGSREETVPVAADTCVAISRGTSFQFRSTGPEPLTAVAVTVPAWPGDEEAVPAEGNPLWNE